MVFWLKCALTLWHFEFSKNSQVLDGMCFHLHTSVWVSYHSGSNILPLCIGLSKNTSRPASYCLSLLSINLATEAWIDMKRKQSFERGERGFQLICHFWDLQVTIEQDVGNVLHESPNHQIFNRQINQGIFSVINCLTSCLKM